MQSLCLKVIDPSSVSNKRIGIIILRTNEDLICRSTVSLSSLKMELILIFFFNVSKCYLLLTSCLYLGTLEKNYISSVMWR